MARPRCLGLLLVPAPAQLLLAALLLPCGEGASLSSSSSSSASYFRGKLLPEQPRKRLAMCIAGNLRTFNVTAPTIRPFLRNLSGVGLASEQPDVFLYGTLASAAAKGQFHYNYAPLDVSRAAAEELARGLQPAAYKLLENAEEVTIENLDKYVVNRHCFRSGFWQGDANIIRSMNQLAHLQGCVDLIMDYEERHKQRYDAVIVARPDMFYEPEGELPESLLDRASQGVFVFQWDWFMLMPRPTVDRLVDPTFARPLNCTKGQPCCGKVKSSEDMFEYFFGASTRRDNGTCSCSSIKAPSYKVTVGRLERTEFIGRGAVTAA